MQLTTDKTAPRRHWAVLAVVAAVMAGAAVWVVSSHTIAGSASPRTLSVPALSWPSGGQTAVDVEGLGRIGTIGVQAPVPIASVTKVMTAYVVLRDHPLRDGEAGPDIVIDQQAEAESSSTEESTAPVRAGQRFSERRLLELMLIPSGNNIARQLARWDAGSQEAFVEKMNRAAADLGMTDTKYTGASGVEDSTTSTASDQLLLAHAAMRDAVIRSIVAMPNVQVGNGGRTLPNTNTLLGRSGVIGLKTGSSTAAGGALMWAAEPTDGATKRLVLGVVLHQNSGNSPRAGLEAALSESGKLIAAVEHALPAIVTANR
ncbi:D-alanyl-D-alanine carboxypeptidase (penicillin-binding protein 5/6) [Amycolatopsis xylanica]|uniref:D-alanyl-D-alanine carboxypeptidase (Penicillin-binding protein 5/6) n=1 Tax=Amycolatopsis xylanica TaxID=589385 RepID=A0A1H2W4R8_9PSEU|nr:serine hydrolase [Amycolatopsis xylanica]SDW75234.1 D-alanyl-D-alanine carboxypeptidase (penicillin-binding protein 5/6) [Amycolatopsis xylanica]